MKIKNIIPFWFSKKIYPTSFLLIEEYKCIYAPIPKVACSTIKVILLRLLNKPILGHIHRENMFHYVTQKSIGDREFKNYFKFAFVRNPWDRIVSCYIDKVLYPPKNYRQLFSEYSWYRSDLSFEEFVKRISLTPDKYADQHFKSQHSFLTDHAGQLAVDYIGKFEHITQDMKYVFEKIGVAPIEIPHVNKAKVKTKHYTEYYDHQTQKLIAERYKKDIELFGYSFEQK